MSPAAGGPRLSVYRRVRQLGGNVVWLSVVSLLNDAAGEAIYPLLPAFLTTVLGGGPEFLGAIEGVADSASSFLNLAGGWVADRVHRRKALVAAGYAIAALVRPLLSLATAPWHILAVRFTDRVGKGIRTAPRDSLLAESAPPRARGLAFGFHSGADHAGAVIGPVAATLFLLAVPGAMRPLFALTLLPGLATVAIVAMRVRDSRSPAGPPPGLEPDAGTAPRDAARTETGRTLHGDGRGNEPGTTPGAPAAHRQGFYAFLGVLLVFTLGNASDAFLLLRAQQLGLALALIPLLWAAFHLSKLSWSVPGGLLADRAGPRVAILLGWLLYAAVYAGFAFAVREWQIWALFLVYGLFYGLTEAPQKALVALYAAPQRRASAYGAYAFAIGLGALPASLIFGWLWQQVRPEAAFLFGGALALAAAVALAFLVPAPPRAA
jgi:MFS family permease